MSIINSDGLNTNWQLNVLRGLQAIADEVAKPLTCAEDGITICSPITGLNVNVHDGTGIPITSTIVGADKGLDVNIINALPLEINLDAANDQVGIYGYDGTTPTPVSVDSNGFVNTNTSIIFPSSLPVTQDPSSDPWTVDGTIIANQGTSPWVVSGTVGVTGEVEIINAVGSPIPVIITAPVPVINVNLDAADDQVGVYGYINGVSTTPFPLNVNATGQVAIQDGGNSITVDGTVITDAATSSVAICGTDGVTNNVAISVSPAGQLLTQSSTLDGAGTAITSTTVSTTTALDVNQVPFVRTPNLKVYITGTGFIAVPVYSITFFNSGSDNELITFDGGTSYENIPAGVSISMDAGGNNTYPASEFGYDILGSGPLIITYNS
jgi:hypothetical protein